MKARKKLGKEAKDKLEEVSSSASQPAFYLPPQVGGQEKEELKLVGNRRIRKKEEGIAGFKKGKFRCTQAAGYRHASCPPAGLL